MTDHNFTNLPALDPLGMLYSAQANYANAKTTAIQSRRSRMLWSVGGSLTIPLMLAML